MFSNETQGQYLTKSSSGHLSVLMHVGTSFCDIMDSHVPDFELGRGNLIMIFEIARFLGDVNALWLTSLFSMNRGWLQSLWLPFWKEAET